MWNNKQVNKFLKNSNMKKYFITSQHDVCIDSYKDGELENVNYYSIDSFISAENAKKAIDLYFENVLFYDFSFENADFEDGILYYSVLVDAENIQATFKDIQVWRMGKKKLYSNNISLKICECIDITNI